MCTQGLARDSLAKVKRWCQGLQGEGPGEHSCGVHACMVAAQLRCGIRADWARHVPCLPSRLARCTSSTHPAGHTCQLSSRLTGKACSKPEHRCWQPACRWGGDHGPSQPKWQGLQSTGQALVTACMCWAHTLWIWPTRDKRLHLFQPAWLATRQKGCSAPGHRW